MLLNRLYTPAPFKGRVRQSSGPRRGIMLLAFVVIVFPFLAFGGFLAVDSTRLIIASRQAELVAQAAARAGASQINPNTGDISVNEATNEAYNILQMSRNTGALSLADSYEISVSDIDVTAESVTVSIPWQIDSLMWAPFFATRSSEDTAVGISVVCDATNPDGFSAGGYCAPPRGGTTD